ncbi:hypothetical protein LguiA_011862 [Lonicera macranthoides]
MSEVEKRKSARIIKLAEQRANKKKNIGATASSSQANANANTSRKKKPKRKRLSEVSNAPIPLPQKTQHQQGEERPGNEKTHAGGSESKNLDLPLPENDVLKFVINVLQCEDKFDIFGQPVNPKEVDHYDTFIKEPMDFGTIRAKLEEGIYKNLNEFEYDVFLVPNNAMMFNDLNTIDFEEALDIKDLAMSVFDKLKTDPNGLKYKFSSKISKKGRKPREEAGSSSTKRGTNSKKRVGGSNDQIGSGDPNIEKRRTYMPSTRNDSILSMDYNGPKQLIPGTSGISYKESLKQFVKDLGPTAHKVAAQKLARCLTKQQPQRHTHPFVQQQPQMPASFMQQRLQMPTHSFMQQSPQVPIGPKMGQRLQAPTQSIMSSNPLIPIRTYNTGIVKGRQAPLVPCDPITMLDANEQLGAQRADKEKGIFSNDDIDISSGTLKNALSGYNNDVFANTRDGNSVLGADPMGKSVVTDGRVPSSGFFVRMLNLENDAGYDIDRYPREGISAKLGDIAAIQNALQEERTRVSNRDVMAARPHEKGDLLLHVLKNQLSSTPNTDFDQRFNLPIARPTYPIPPARPAIGPNSSLLEFVSGQNNRPRPSVHPTRVVTPSRLSQMIAPMNPSFQASSAELNELPGWNPPTPWGSQQVKEVIALGMGAAPPEFTRPIPYSHDIMRRLELQQQQPVPVPRVYPLACDSRKLRQTASISLPARLASPLDLLGALSRQELQHMSTAHGQQGDTVPVDRGARPQQGPQDNAGPSGQLTHQELQDAPDPHVGHSGSNPVDQAVRQEQEFEQALPANYRYFPLTFSRRKRLGNLVGQDRAGPEGLGAGAGAPQEGQQQEAGTNDPNLLNYRQQYPDLVLQLGAKPPPSL